MHRIALPTCSALALLAVAALAAAAPTTQPASPAANQNSVQPAEPGGVSPAADASSPEVSGGEVSGAEVSGGAAPGADVAAPVVSRDPCAFAEYLARLPACLEAKSCEAHDLWRRLLGTPGPRVLSPRDQGPAPLHLAREAPRPVGPVLRLPGGGEPSPARGSAGNLAAPRSVFGETPRTVPLMIPCPARR